MTYEKVIQMYLLHANSVAVISDEKTAQLLSKLPPFIDSIKGNDCTIGDDNTNNKCEEDLALILDEDIPF